MYSTDLILKLYTFMNLIFILLLLSRLHLIFISNTNDISVYGFGYNRMYD